MVQDILEESDFSELLELIRSRIFLLLKNNLKRAEDYNSIAKYEMAVFEVSQKKSESFIKKIEINHSEEQILRMISNPEYIVEFMDQIIHLMIIWDPDNQKVKCMEIPSELLMLL